MKARNLFIVSGIFGISALAFFLAAGTTQAFWPFGPGPGPQSQERFERRQEVLDSIKDGNYDKWKELMGSAPITEKINKDNFSKFSEMHKYLSDGNIDKAKEVRNELGIDFPARRGTGDFRGGHCWGRW